MQRFNFPMQIPEGHKLSLTQPFGATAIELEPAGPNGEPHFHYGVDVQDANAAQTYGTPLVCPFPTASVVGYYLPDQNGRQTPWVKLQGTGSSGKVYTILFAHISAVFFRNEYKEGDVFALAGNSGLVTPVPSPADPFAGAHLHLGCVVDGHWADPLEYFDIESPYRGEGPQPTSKLPRLEWALQQLLAQWQKLTASDNA